MTDNELFAQAVVDIFDQRGEDATHTPTGGGSPATLKVIIGTSLELQPDGGSLGTYITADQLLAVLPAADVAHDPRRNDLITITETSKVYIIQSKIEDDGYFITVSIIEQ